MPDKRRNVPPKVPDPVTPPRRGVLAAGPLRPCVRLCAWDQHCLGPTLPGTNTTSDQHYLGRTLPWTITTSFRYPASSISVPAGYDFIPTVLDREKAADHWVSCMCAWHRWRPLLPGRPNSVGPSSVGASAVGLGTRREIRLFRHGIPGTGYGLSGSIPTQEQPPASWATQATFASLHQACMVVSVQGSAGPRRVGAIFCCWSK